jgi:hypothetical protein
MIRGTSIQSKHALGERTVCLRIRLAHLAPRSYGGYSGIEAGIQVEKDVLPGTIGTDGLLRFSAELRARRDPATGVVFLGAYAFGPRDGRFLYLSWSHDHEGTRAMFRRMKVHLKSITWDQIEEASETPGFVLETVVPGVGRDGGPACASVPLLEAWHVCSADIDRPGHTVPSNQR